MKKSILLIPFISLLLFKIYAHPFNYALKFGGSLADEIGDITSRTEGNIISTGIFYSNFFNADLDADVLNISTNGNDDIGIIKTTTVGELIWTSPVDFSDTFLTKYCSSVILENYISISKANSICADGTFKYEAVTNYDYFLTPVGCDSVITLDFGEDIDACDGDTIILNAENEGAEYEWNTGETTQTIYVTEQGNYTVKVSYSPTCTVRDTIFISFQNIPSVDIGADIEMCAGDSALLNSGNPGETYLWNTGGTTQKIWVYDAGAYSVILTNSSGCSNYDTIEVALNPLPVVELPDSINVCEGDLIVVDAGDDGVSYDWNNGLTTQIITITTPGNYTVKVKNEYGCTTKDTVNVEINGLPNVNLGPDLDACFDEPVNLNAGNASSDHLWNTGVTTQIITVTESGIYSVEVTNPAGCSASDEIEINFHENPDIDLGGDLSMCSGDEITLNAGAGWDTYDWTTGQTTQSITVSTPGNYAVDVTNEFGCVGSDTIHIEGITLPVVNLGADIDACDGETILLDAENSGASYNWTTGATTQTISVTETGSYVVEVTYSGGCFATDAIHITFHENPVVDLGEDVEICPGESIILNAENAGATFEWNTGATTQAVSASEQGNYSVLVTSAFGCTSEDVIFVDELPSPNVNLGSDIESCEGEIILLDAENVGSEYAWNTGATIQIISVNENGNYFVEVTDENGCVGSDTIDIHFNEIPDVDLGEDINICIGDTIILDAEIVDATYEWNIGATTQTIAVTEEGTYSVIVTTEFGCIDNDVLHVDEFSPPVVDLGSDIQVCEGGVIILDAENEGCTFLWSTGETTQTIAVEEPGSYSVQVTNIVGCSTSDIAEVGVGSPPVVDLGGDTYVCEGGSLILDAENTGSDYLWNTGATTQTITVTEAGEYFVYVAALSGCSNTDTISIVVLPAPIIELGDDFILCEGETTILDAGLSGYEYLWNTEEITQTIIISEAGEYSVTMTNTLTGCASTDNITVENGELPLIEINTNHDDTICLLEDAVPMIGEPVGGIFSGPGMSASMFDPFAAGLGLQTVTYTYTDANGCTNSASFVFYVDVCDGLSEVKNAEIKIYPNPAIDYFIIEFTQAENATLFLYDVNGIVLLYEKINKQQNIIAIGNIPAGIYMIQVRSDEIFF